MNKVIATHLRPDLDACSASWLIKKYFPGFNEAEVVFIPAGQTYGNAPVDLDQNVVNTDTGMGKFDHHQLTEKTSSARQVFNYLLEQKLVFGVECEALERLVDVVTFFDNFQQATLVDAAADYQDFNLVSIMDGFEHLTQDDSELFRKTEEILEGLLIVFKCKVQAEIEIKCGYEFTVGNYRCLGLETRNEEATHLAQKMGYQLVIRKDPKSNRARIKCHPATGPDLDKVFEAFVALGEEKRWYLHVSKKMLLNGSSRNQTFPPTNLNLRELIKIIKENLI